MNTNLDNIETLVLKYCEGKSTLAEAQIVEAWMSESEENYQQVKQCYLILLADSANRLLDDIVMDKALSHIHNRMGINEKKKTIIKRDSWRIIERWAAILFLPVTLSLLTLLLQKVNKEDVSLITISTNPGMTSTFRLPDSTLVCLNSGSELIYPSQFNGHERKVQLKGEAYFEVTPDVNHRFILSTLDNTQIEVLGTKFNVEAYDESNEISTTLLQGHVHFLYQKDGQEELVGLHPCEKVIYDKTLDSHKVLKTACLSELAWKDGKIIFDNTSFKDALWLLEKRFNVEFKVKNPEYWKYRFTGTFVKQHLEQILDYFKISSHINWSYIKEPPKERERAVIELN